MEVENLINHARAIATRTGVAGFTLEEVSKAANVPLIRLEDQFGNEHNFMNWVVWKIVVMKLDQIEHECAKISDLEKQLSIYFHEMVTDMYIRINEIGDFHLLSDIAEDGVRRYEHHSDVDRQKINLLIKILMPYEQVFIKHGQSAEKLAHFISATTGGFLFNAPNLEALNQLLVTLKMMVISSAGASFSLDNKRR